MNTKLHVLFISLLILSCGKKVEDKRTDGMLEELSQEGVYETILLPVNAHISKNIHGDVKIVQSGDLFEVKVKIYNSPKLPLKQEIRTGSACPENEDDTNRNGIIDFMEGQARVGKILIPLDGDLGSQESGFDLTLSGNYQYRRSTSYSLMLGDLELADGNPNDEYVKLGQAFFQLGNRTITITETKTNLLVACGVLVKTYDNPFDSTDITIQVPSFEPVSLPTIERPAERVPESVPVPAPQEETRPRGWRRLRDRVSGWWKP